MYVAATDIIGAIVDGCSLLRHIVTGSCKATSVFPNFPALKDCLTFWETTLDGPLFAVTVAHSKLIKPAELRAVDGVFRLH
jgi:uncharacterized protein Usg